MDTDAAAPQGTAIDPQSRDLVIRTVLGEAGNQSAQGQAAVASVILNRLRSGEFGASDARDIVLAPNQFEAWSVRPRELLAISPNSPAYKRVGNIVDGVFSGTTRDPTNGATHFLNPNIVRERNGGVIPQKWAQGPGQRIGQHVFFKPDSGAQPEAQSAAYNGPDYLGMALKGGFGASGGGSGADSEADGGEVPDYLGMALKAAERKSAAPISAVPPSSNMRADGSHVPVPDPAVSGTPEPAQPPGSQVSEFTERTLKPFARLPSTIGEVASDYGHRLYQLVEQGGRTVSHGLEDIGENRPATGIGEVGLGLLGATGAFTQALDVPAAKLTGNPEFGEKLGMVGPGIGVGYVANALRPTVSALRDIIGDVGAENLPQVIRRMERNPGLTLMDTSPAVRGNAAGLATDPRNAPAMNYLNDFQRARMADRQGATIDAFEDALGPTPNAKETLEALKAKAQQTGKDLIEPAIDNASLVDVTKVVKNIDKQFDPAMLRQLKAGQTVSLPMSDEAKRLWALRQRLRGNLKDRDTMLMSPDEAHEMQMELRQKYASDPQLGYEARQIRRNLIDAIDQAADGEYKPALKQYADDKSVEDAFKKGFDLFANPTSAEKSLANDPSMWRAWAQDASQAEVDAVKKGAMLGARTRIVNMRKGIDIPEGSFAHDRLAAIVGNQAADKIVQTLNDWRDIAQTDNLLTKNSATAVRQAGQKARSVRQADPNTAQKWTLPVLAGIEGFHATGSPIWATGAVLGAKGASKLVGAIGRMHDIASNNAYAQWAAATGPKRELLLNVLRQAAARSDPASGLQKLLNFASPALLQALPQ